MNRSPRRPTGVQNETAPGARSVEAPVAGPAAEPARAGLGWRIAVVVWLFGFFGLVLFELWGLVSGLLRK